MKAGVQGREWGPKTTSARPEHLPRNSRSHNEPIGPHTCNVYPPRVNGRRALGARPRLNRDALAAHTIHARLKNERRGSSTDLLDDNIPGVDGPRRGHEVREDGICGEDVSLALHCEVFHDRVVRRGHVVELFLLAALPSESHHAHKRQQQNTKTVERL